MKKTDKIEMEDIIFRQIELGDIPAISRLEKEIFTDAWPEDAFYELLNRDDTFSLKVIYKKEVIAYAVYVFDVGEAHLANFAVVPRFRGKSIAKYLLNRILEIAREAECENIFLDVRPSNRAAISLYKKFGFMELYRKEDYYITPREDAIVMVKNLREV